MVRQIRDFARGSALSFTTQRTDGFAFQAGLSHKPIQQAELLLAQIGEWPVLNDLLAEEARFRARSDDAEGLGADGILRHRQGVTFRPDCAVACHVVRHFMASSGGLRYTDLGGPSWAVCGSFRAGGTLAAISFPGLTDLDLTVCRRLPDKCPAAWIRRKSELQDVTAAFELLHRLADLATQRETLQLSMTPAELAAAIGISHPDLADVVEILATAGQFRLRELSLPPSRWKFAVSQEAIAAEFAWLRADLVVVRLGELLESTLRAFAEQIVGE